MTFNEVIYDIREALKLQSADSDVTDRQIAFLIRNARSLIVRQFIANNPGENRDMLSQSVYMDLELVDQSVFPGITTGFTLLATTEALPNVIGEQMYKDIEVRTAERLGREVEMLQKQRAAEYMYAPAGFIYGWREDDGKLYLVSKDRQFMLLEQIIVTAIFEDPEAALRFNEADASLERYPITGSIWMAVREMVLQQLGNQLNIPFDVLNNAKEDRNAEAPQK